MAFVRWRGGCAPRLATVWDDGRPRQLLLTHLPGYAAPVARREAIAARFPTLTVDWAAVDRALAPGPPGPPGAHAHGPHVGRDGPRSPHLGPHHRCAA